MPKSQLTAADVPLSVRRAWPKLSETLVGLFPVAPDLCQECGVTVDDADDTRRRTRWIEHDEWDRPTHAVIVLCRSCAEDIIEPHPRLYAEMPIHKPHPGTMALCGACIHRTGLRCTHPNAKANGGPGIVITYAPPLRAFMDGTRGGRRAGWVTEIYPSAPTVCNGRAQRHDAEDAHA